MGNEILLGITWDEVAAYQRAHMAPEGTPWEQLTLAQRDVWLYSAWTAKHRRRMPYRDETATQQLAAKIAVAAAPNYVDKGGANLANYALAAAAKILE